VSDRVNLKHAHTPWAVAQLTGTTPRPFVIVALPLALAGLYTPHLVVGATNHTMWGPPRFFGGVAVGVVAICTICNSSRIDGQ
jgi:hypothetical protein